MDAATSGMPDVARARMGGAFRSLLKIAEAESTGRLDQRWKLIDTRYDMRVFRKAAVSDDGKQMYAFRAMTIIDAAPSLLESVIMNFSLAKRWIPAMRELRTLKSIDDNTDIVYLGRYKRRLSDYWSTYRSPAQMAATGVAMCLVFSGLMLLLQGEFVEGIGRIVLGSIFFVTSSDTLAVWPRDLVLMRHRHRVSERTIVVGLKSVADENMPPRSSWRMVRGSLTGGGFIIQGLGNGKSRVSFVSQADFGGWAGIYGSYGMHLDQMALLISLKNYMHSEVVATSMSSMSGVTSATASTSVLATGNSDRRASVVSGFSPSSRLSSVNENHARLILEHQQQQSFSSDSGTGTVNSMGARVQDQQELLQVISATPDPFGDSRDHPRLGSSTRAQSANMATTTTTRSSTSEEGGGGGRHATSPHPDLRREHLKRSLSMGGESGGDTVSEEQQQQQQQWSSKEPDTGEPNLARYPSRVSYELPRPPGPFGEDAVQCRAAAVQLLSNDEGWERAGSSKGVELWKRDQGAGKPPLIRGVLRKVGCSAGCFIAAKLDPETKGLWDPMYREGHAVEIIDDWTIVAYERFHPIFPTSGRDFVLLYSLMKRNDGSYLQCSRSVEHPDCPEVGGVVRARLLFGSTLATPTGPNTCDVTYSLCIDLRGSIPGWIVARVSTESPAVLATIRDLILRRDENIDGDPLEARFESCKSVIGPPQTSAPIPLGADDEASVEPIASNVHRAREDQQDTTGSEADDDGGSPRTPNRSIQLGGGVMSPSPASRLQSGGSRSLGIASELAHLVRPDSAGALSVDDAAALGAAMQRLLGLATERTPAWGSRGQVDDVAVMSRAPEAGGLRAFRGHGAVNASAARVVALLQDLSAQRRWDPLFKGGIVVERYDGPLQAELRFVVYQTSQCTPKAARCFVYLYGYRLLADGTHLLVALSRPRPDIPPFREMIRGTIEASGWVIQPAADNPLRSLCTYVACVDLVGLPSTVINIVSQKQPLVVAGVRKVLTGTKRDEASPEKQ